MKHFNHAKAAVALTGAMLAMPVSAFAEESENKAEILVPKMAEFVPALIAFLIIFIVLAKFAWPQILQTMEERGKRIKDSLDEAETTKRKAIEARKEAADIVTAARQDAESERARIIAKAHEEAEDIIAKAHANAEDERNSIYAAAAGSIADLSVSVATKIVGEALENDDEQRRLIERYIKEAGSLNA